jgi:thioredoxin-like negative regulator of GroEL
MDTKETFPMTPLILAAFLQTQAAALPEINAARTPINTVPQTDYATALKRSTAAGRPLVVLLGADWCPACVQMKGSILPRVAKAGGLKDIEFAYVDLDRDPKLAGRLIQANAIPQLIRFEKTEKGWQRDLLTGARSVKQVSAFIAGEQRKRDERVTRDGPESWTAALISWAKSIAGAN